MIQIYTMIQSFYKQSHYNQKQKQKMNKFNELSLKQKFSSIGNSPDLLNRKQNIKDISYVRNTHLNTYDNDQYRSYLHKNGSLSKFEQIGKQNQKVSNIDKKTKEVEFELNLLKKRLLEKSQKQTEERKINQLIKIQNSESQKSLDISLEMNEHILKIRNNLQKQNSELKLSIDSQNRGSFYGINDQKQQKLNSLKQNITNAQKTMNNVKKQNQIKLHNLMTIQQNNAQLLAKNIELKQLEINLYKKVVQTQRLKEKYSKKFHQSLILKAKSIQQLQFTKQKIKILVSKCSKICQIQQKFQQKVQNILKKWHNSQSQLQEQEQGYSQQVKKYAFSYYFLQDLKYIQNSLNKGASWKQIKDQLELEFSECQQKQQLKEIEQEQEVANLQMIKQWSISQIQQFRFLEEEEFHKIKFESEKDQITQVKTECPSQLDAMLGIKCFQTNEESIQILVDQVQEYDFCDF